jgi:hypothetical protein
LKISAEFSDSPSRKEIREEVFKAKIKMAKVVNAEKKRGDSW